MGYRFKNNRFERHSKKYSSYYINRFMSMNCAVDMMSAKLFPNAKEITESFGGFEAINYLEGLEWDDPNVNVVVVGDGHTPRTAATFAFRTNWTCHSVDPIMRDRKYNIKRLSIYPHRIQDLEFTFDTPVVILHVHSHVKAEVTLSRIKAPVRHLISIPCCVPQYLNREPDVRYNDTNIWSEKNEVLIWRNV